MEEWRYIEGFEGVYEISSLGKVRSYLNNRHGIGKYPKIIKGSLGNNGYYTVSLHNPITKMSKVLLVHRVVASTFLPNTENKKCVDHINTLRTDNRVENLKWVTHSENNNNEITHERMTFNLRKYASTHKGSKSASAKPVGQYTKNGDLVCSFGSIVEASEKTGISIRKITHNIHGDQRFAEGFVFKLL